MPTDTAPGTVQHKRLPLCGHDFLFGSTPRMSNCESCWFAYFQVHGETTQLADEVFQKHGLSALRQIQGKKFAENFVKFMSTVAQWKKQIENPTQSTQTVQTVQTVHTTQTGQP